MLEQVGKWKINEAIVVSILVVGLSGLIHKTTMTVNALDVLPNNHEIEQLHVEMVDKWYYSIDIGKRKGTLLVRIDPPKVERDVEWLNHSITKPTLLNMALFDSLRTHDEDAQSYVISFTSGIESFIAQNGIYKDHRKFIGSRALSNRLAIQKFSSYNYPNYYIGLAGYIDDVYSKDGKYLLFGSSYLLKEAGQVKAYFYEEQDVVLEAYNRIADNGVFPLMDNVMWGKTELRKGQLGKVTIQQPTTLWKHLSNGKYEKGRNLSVGEEYRVYRYINEGNEYYGVGGGTFVRKENAIKYETPSKKNLRLIEIQNGEGYESYTSTFKTPKKLDVWKTKVEDYKEIFPEHTQFSTDSDGFNVYGEITHEFNYEGNRYSFNMNDTNRDPVIAAKVLIKAGIYKGKEEALVREILRISKSPKQKGQLDNIQMMFESSKFFYIYWGPKTNFYELY